MLKIVIYILLIMGTAVSWAQNDAPTETTEPVIKPPLERRNIKLPRIDTENIEVGGYSGVFNAEDFGSHFLVGVQLDYHITEDFFLDLTYGQSKLSDETFARSTIFLFEEREIDLDFYNLSLGYNIFPGEIFIGGNWAFNTAMYVMGGLGNTGFNNEDHFTTTVGFGTRILLTDWFALHIDTRDHMYETDITGAKKLTHNFTVQGGFTIFF